MQDTGHIKQLLQKNKTNLLMPKENIQKILPQKAINQALTKASDGASYYWQHKKSFMQGRVHPTSTYRNAKGQLCRHFHYYLSLKNIKQKSEALACRNNLGQWVVKS